MSDDLERRLQIAFHDHPLPPAPASLVHGLERVPDAPVEPRRRPAARSSVGLLVAAVVIVGAGALAIAVGSRPQSVVPVAPSGPPATVAPSGEPAVRIELRASQGVPTAAEMSTTVSILQARVNATGVVGGTVEQSGSDTVVIVMPGVGDERDPIVNWIASTGRVDLVPTGDQAAIEGSRIDLAAQPPLLGGDAIASVQLGVDDATGATTLQIGLTPDAASTFAQYTAANIGSFFAVVLDGHVVLAPAIQAAITGGDIVISLATANSTDGTAQATLYALVTDFHTGLLPVPLEVTSATVIRVAGSSPPASPDAATSGQTPVPTSSGQTAVSGADAAAAAETVRQYTQALVDGDYPAAWALLAPQARAQSGSMAQFSDERAAFFVSVAGRFKVVVSPPDVAPLTDWLSATDGATIDLGRAVLVEVDYPALAGNNAGYELYIVNPAATDAGWELFNVR